jgi:ABC-2 type transport system permease protein
MFDREFGFLNRLLVAPLASRFSIVAASAIYIIALSFIQTAVIVTASALLGAGLPNILGLARSL